MAETLPSTEIWALPAGRQVDAQVTAALRRGARPESWTPPNDSRWSSDARVTCALITELATPYLRAAPWQIALYCEPAGRDGVHRWTCRILEAGASTWWGEATADTLPLAFCRAFLDCAEEPTDG